MSGPKIAEQIAELRRERNMRRRVYPKLISSGKLKPNEAQYSNQCLEAAITTLEFMRDNRDVIIAAVNAARVTA
jgi:hypothetical protein